MHLVGRKTDGTFSLTGEPKIFVCCHPRFSNEKRERLITLLLDILSATTDFSRAIVYYDDDFENGAVEEQEIFDRTNLVLFVASRECFDSQIRDFLQERCYRVWQAAEIRGIPIVPVVEGQDCMEPFNRVYGMLHCLNMSSTFSGTTPSKAERFFLERWIQEILLSDNTMDKIRNAFEAYIFLSYRKKDRAYVEHLMSILHSNPQWRDIAVWFDDYLKPGEDFNDAIQQAMEKSKMFALLVTPHLLEGGNYVMTTEYVYANQENKMVLPVEFVKTDSNDLRACFPNIPEIISAQDQSAQEQALDKAAMKLDFHGENQAPEHLFYIGLAYLAGVDVERDNTRAEQLILQSAEAGFLQGIRQIAVLYRRGMGVPRNLDQAIHWQKIYLRELYAEYEKTRMEGSILKADGNYTEEEHFFFHFSRDLVDGLTYLIGIYLEAGLNIRSLCREILPIGREIFEKRLLLYPLVSLFSMIVGYEKSQDKNGKWMIGKSIKENRAKLTGCVYDYELAKLLLRCETELFGREDACACGWIRWRETYRYADVCQLHMNGDQKGKIFNLKRHTIKDPKDVEALFELMD